MITIDIIIHKKIDFYNIFLLLGITRTFKPIKAKTHSQNKMAQKTTLQFNIEQPDIGFVIGHKGKTIHLIMERTGAYVNLRKFVSPENGKEYSYFHIEGTSEQANAAYNWVKTVAQENYERRTNPSHVAPPRGTIHYPQMPPSSAGSSYTTEFPTLPGHSGVAPPLPANPPRTRTPPVSQPQPELGYIPPQNPPMAFMPGQFFPAGAHFPMMPPAPMFFQPPILPPQPDPNEFPQQYQHPPPDDPHHFTEVGNELDKPFIAEPCGCQVDIPGEIEIPDEKSSQREILDGLFGLNQIERSAQCPHCPAPLIALK